MKKLILPILTVFLVTVSQVLSGAPFSVEETGQVTDCEGKLHRQIEVSDGTTTLSVLIPDLSAIEGATELEDADEEGAFYSTVDWKGRFSYYVIASPLDDLLETDIAIVDQDSLEESARLGMAMGGLTGTVKAITCPAGNIIAAVEYSGTSKENRCTSITREYITSTSIFSVDVFSFTYLPDFIGSPSCDFIMDSIEIR